MGKILVDEELMEDVVDSIDCDYCCIRGECSEIYGPYTKRKIGKENCLKLWKKYLQGDDINELE